MALQHFHHYVLGQKVILRTDHHSLKWLKTFKQPEGILARWIKTMAEYDYDIEHRPGRLHSNADALSRQTCKQCWGKVAPTHWIDECERAEEVTHPLSIHTITMVPEFTMEDIAQLQAEDPERGSAYRVMQEGLDPSPDELRGFRLESRALLSLQPEVRMEGEVLVKGQHESARLIVPMSLRYRLFQTTHAGPTAAHLGPLRTTLQLRQSYYWRGMKKDVADWYRQCDECAKGKGPPVRPHGHLQKVQVGAPLDLVTMDVVSGLPTATDGSKYVLVVVDAFTKWVEIYALPDQKASTCMTAVYNGFLSRFGLPRQLHSDQGRNFESVLVRELCTLIGIHKIRTTPFHPRSDGLTERANRTLLQMLRAVTDEHPQEWPSKLPALLAAYRMSVHSTTVTTPNYAMLGREVLLPCTFIAAPPHDTVPNIESVTDLRINLREAHHRIVSHFKPQHVLKRGTLIGASDTSCYV